MGKNSDLLMGRLNYAIKEQMDYDYARKGVKLLAKSSTDSVTGSFYGLKVDFAGSEGVAFDTLTVGGEDLSAVVLGPGDVLFGDITAIKLKTSRGAIDTSSVDCNVILSKK